MKRIIFISTILMSLLALGSCQEQEEAGEYDNWKERNQNYVDSIAKLAETGAYGWTKMVSFTLSDSVEAANPDNNHYIYIQKLEQGEGTRKALYNDSIRVHYQGRLISSDSYPQGRVFDKSYSSQELNEATDVPSLMAVKGTVTGFATAMLNMVEGDRWKVVIPYYLAYGESDYSAIPGYSALTFDIKMARIYRFKVDTDTSWH